MTFTAKIITTPEGAVNEGMDVHNPVHDSDISRLCTGLVKAGRTRSKVMPIAPFHALF